MGTLEIIEVPLRDDVARSFHGLNRLLSRELVYPEYDKAFYRDTTQTTGSTMGILC